MENKAKSALPAGSFLPPYTLEILQLIRDRGGMICTGSCHSQKPGQLHCRQIGKILNIGFSVVWKRIDYMISENLVARERTGNGPVKFIITPKGEKML